MSLKHRVFTQPLIDFYTKLARKSPTSLVSRAVSLSAKARTGRYPPNASLPLAEPPESGSRFNRWFLYPGKILEAKGLMPRKGFPESYDRQALLQFLSDLKSGKQEVSMPVYSHAFYDITDEVVHIESPDILIIEGLNILQTGDISSTRRVYASDFIDFNIFVDSPTPIIKSWFLERFRAFREQAIDRPDLFFYQFTTMPDDEAFAFASHVWETVNAPNLEKNILPYKFRAELILEKGADHGIEHVYLKKI